MTGTKLDLRTFEVVVDTNPELPHHKVRAAYFKDEGGFVTFKDADNQAVFAIRADRLRSIERLPDTEPKR